MFTEVFAISCEKRVRTTMQHKFDELATHYSLYPFDIEMRLKCYSE